MTDEDRKKMAGKLVIIVAELDQMSAALLANVGPDVSSWKSHDRAAFRLLDESHWRLVAAAGWLNPLMETAEAEKGASDGIF